MQKLRRWFITLPRHGRMSANMYSKPKNLYTMQKNVIPIAFLSNVKALNSCKK